MSDNAVEVIKAFLIFGWIPILAIGKVIRDIVSANKCDDCACKTCNEECFQTSKGEE